MITTNKKIFKLDTKHTSYIFTINSQGHPCHVYYGSRLPSADVAALSLKNTIGYGSSVEYTPGYCLDCQLLEFSGIGKGDYRHSPVECIMPDGTYVTDFVYEGHRITEEAYDSNCGLPFATGRGETLTVWFRDQKFRSVRLFLNYTVFYDCDVICRNTELHNGENDPVIIRKLMSAMADFPEADYTQMSLAGGWAKEAHIQTVPVSAGLHVTESTTGGSSNRYNPAFALLKTGADERQGEVMGFNLIYSGNHYSAVEKTAQDTMRIMLGINPHCFRWTLNYSEKFVTPQAVMTWTDQGINGMAANFHAFVNRHIVPEYFQYRQRPVVLNNWEATFFHFNRSKILNLAKQAKDLGVEMFVLDDGWFGKRNNDKAGLGDWEVNEKKLPGGIRALSRDIHRMGLKFGLWVEPECVNEDSDLYRAHPDWAIQIPGREPSRGRNQMVLDLTREEVRDYLVDAIHKVLHSGKIEYMKWDYNRHISDMYSSGLSDQGEFFHRYILGLYDVLRRIFQQKHPNILLEGCSSGGNRFDLGWLCFAPQIWTSDDTDARERLEIQRGVSCFYPLSTMSNHVSMIPNQQTLRSVPLSTRFNVAAFGVLGYELDFGELTPEEQKQIKKQIEFYKAHRQTLQFGKFSRYFPKAGSRESWQMADEKEIIAAIYNLTYEAAPARDVLRILDATPGKRYRFKSVRQQLQIGRFGGLIKHISPVKLRTDGKIMKLADRNFSLTDGQEDYICAAETLRGGINLAMQYSGTGYNSDIRVLGDFGSSLYLIEETK